MLQMLQGRFQRSAGLAHPAACLGNRVLQHLQHLASAMPPMHPVSMLDVANVACTRVTTLTQFWPLFMFSAPVFSVPRAHEQHLQQRHQGIPYASVRQLRNRMARRLCNGVASSLLMRHGLRHRQHRCRSAACLRCVLRSPLICIPVAACRCSAAPAVSSTVMLGSGHSGRYA